jgi:hypothetical protein
MIEIRTADCGGASDQMRQSFGGVTLGSEDRQTGTLVKRSPEALSNYHPTTRIFRSQIFYKTTIIDRRYSIRSKALRIKMSTAELATSYAALILADDGVDITVGSLL